MNDFQVWSLIISGAGVIVTLIVIIVAVFGERIRQLWRSPKLKIKLDEPTFTPTQEGIVGWYYRIKVWNERKSISAEDTRLTLNKVYKKAPDDTWHEQLFSGPTQVMWQWVQLAPIRTTIGYNEETATFGRILNNSNTFDLRLYLTPNNLNGVIPIKEPTRLEFQAVANNAISKILLVEVSWDGEFSEGRLEMDKHCIVKEVK